MNQYFNVTRFGRLLRKHTFERWKALLMSAGALLGGMVLLLGFVTHLNHNQLGEQLQAVLYLLFLLAAGSFFTSTALGHYGAGQQAALALTLPASQLEKFLVAWLLSLPIFLGVFGLLFYAADWLVLRVLVAEDSVQLPLVSAKLFSAVRLYLVLHGIALWGGIYFTRLQPVKIAFLGFSLALGVGLLNYRWLKQLLGAGLHQAFPFGQAVLEDGVLELPEAQAQWLTVLPLALAVLLWLAAHARLTEKQI